MPAGSSWAWRPRRRAFHRKPWRPAGCSSRSSRWDCTRKVWGPTKPTAAASSWRGSWHGASPRTSGHRSPPPDGWAVYAGAVPVCAGGERLLLSCGPTAALSPSAPDRAWGHLQRHGGAVPRVSAETRLHAGRLSELFVHWEEPARERVRALVATPAYERSRRDRYQVEALFAELKQRLRVGRVRLRRLWNVAEQFHSGGDRSESQTACAVHRPWATDVGMRAEDHLRRDDAKKTSRRTQPAISRTRVTASPPTQCLEGAHFFNSFE